MKSSFVAQLPRIYALYTGGFIAFVLLLAVAEQFGLPDPVIGWIFLATTIGLYGVIGVLSRTGSLPDYYVAGRQVPAVFNGMAIGADWMSAASFIGLAGTLFAFGFDGLAYITGWTGGYVLVALLIAPYLRKFGQFTLPDFLGARYGGHTARAVGVIATIAVSFTYVVAQIVGAGIIVSRFLGLPYEFGVAVGLMGLLFCSLLGGMRAVTWTQVAQYIILIIAYVTPLVFMSWQLTGSPFPQLAYGEALTQIAAFETQLGVTAPFIAPFQQFDVANFIALSLCLMVGTAALPHVLMRFYTTPSVRTARSSAAWALFFILLLYLSAPAYAAFAKLAIYQQVIGVPLDALPEWVAAWTNVGLVAVNDLNRDGILQLAELTLHSDVIVLATPEIAGLPYVVAGLVAAGGLAAALSTADGILLTISNALSHDLYYKIINPKASARRRLAVARGLLLVVAVVAAAIAMQRPAGILAIVAWAFSLAAASFFPALVLGIFWSRANGPGAIAGMVAGFGVTLFYLVAVNVFAMPLWFGIQAVAAGVFGIPVAFLVTVIGSLLTAPPDNATQALVQDIRYPNLDRFDP